MAKRHYHRVDLLKGIAILLVVAGHALDYNTASHVGEHFLWRDYLFWLIYSFHMQLFFALSGFLDGGSSADRLSFIRRKAVRLLVPYSFVGLLYMPFKMGLSALARQTFDPSVLWQIFLGNNPDAGLWFLYVLFLISVIVRL
ncbi:MAG: acyltransferase, partial [Clostridia bacterium]|nr:acyltransferase [Clostridia bacterium]